MNTALCSNQVITKSAWATTHFLLTLMQSGSQKISVHNRGQSILKHSQQTADHVRKCNPERPAVLAGFFHDIGYLAPSRSSVIECNNTVINPSAVGADLLKALGFCGEVTTIIKKIPDAQRYIQIIKNNNVMSTQEKEAFEQSPHFSTLMAIMYSDFKGIFLPNPVFPVSYYKKQVEFYITNRYTQFPQLTELPLVKYLRTKEKE